MEKILFVTDAMKLNRQYLEFACYLSNLTGSVLTGVFLENQVMELRSEDTIRAMAAVADIPGTPLEVRKELCRDVNIDHFKNKCRNGWMPIMMLLPS